MMLCRCFGVGAPYVISNRKVRVEHGIGGWVIAFTSNQRGSWATRLHRAHGDKMSCWYAAELEPSIPSAPSHASSAARRALIKHMVNKPSRAKTWLLVLEAKRSTHPSYVHGYNNQGYLAANRTLPTAVLPVIIDSILCGSVSQRTFADMMNVDVRKASGRRGGSASALVLIRRSWLPSALQLKLGPLVTLLTSKISTKGDTMPLYCLCVYTMPSTSLETQRSISHLSEPRLYSAYPFYR